MIVVLKRVTTGEYIRALKASRRMGHQVAAHRWVDEHPPEWSDLPGDLPPILIRLMDRLKIRRLYAHQLEAIEAIRGGRHVVAATPTASGKSLIYNLPLFEAVAADENTRALYIFPLKALTRDQLKTVELWSALMDPAGPRAAVYDGDTSAYRRKKIRDDPPHVVMTNPEMVHLALLAFHAKWQTFFANLKMVVIDEVHTYRGLLGSHMAQVLRRLRRICRIYGARPTFVFASATIANPGRLAHQLTGLEVLAVEKSGAPQGGRHILLLDPDQGPAQAAILLLKAAMARNLRTIVYTQSRKMAELITLWLQQQAGGLADKISVYRAGLTPQQRRGIEDDLRTGRLLAVVSTSALELGIDIGDLDICILAGYPGSMMATLQRAGRVGRQGQEAALILLAGRDALDQFYIRNPRKFFHAEPEAAVTNPLNPVVLEAHLVCAAAEAPLNPEESWLREPGVKEAASRLMEEGRLLQSADGKRMYTHRKRPHREVDLRSAGSRYRIVADGAPIGEINGFRLYRETHPGAVYLHQGRSYLIESVDEAEKSVFARRRNVNYHTRVRSDSDIAILETDEKIDTDDVTVYIGKVKVTDQVIGFQQVQNSNGRTLDYMPLEVPPSVFTTDGIWFEVTSRITERILGRGHDLPGALHAAEHAAIGVMPLQVLADRNDLGGLSTPYHPQVNNAAIFIYDGIPGGAGLSRQAFEDPRALLARAAAAIGQCDCEEGCPACIHSPKCGSGNQPMDKRGAHLLLQQMSRWRNKVRSPGGRAAASRVPAPPAAVTEPSAVPLRYGVFDLETQLSAREVGGWHMAHRMRVSCGVVYDSGDDTFTTYLEDRVDQLIEHFHRLDLVVGFNSKRFDYQVLSAYTQEDLTRLHSLDLLEAVRKTLGFRLSLDHLALQTLQTQKSGSGLDALEWWRQGRIDKIIDYCRRDVRITRDLYRFARDKGYLVYRSKDGDRLRVPMPMVAASR